MLWDDHLLIKVLLNQEGTYPLVDQMFIYVMNNLWSNKEYTQCIHSI